MIPAGQSASRSHPPPARAPEEHVIAGVPHAPQRSMRCGPKGVPAQSRHASPPPHSPHRSNSLPLLVREIDYKTSMITD